MRRYVYRRPFDYARRLAPMAWAFPAAVAPLTLPDCPDEEIESPYDEDKADGTVAAEGGSTPYVYSLLSAKVETAFKIFGTTGDGIIGIAQSGGWAANRDAATGNYTYLSAEGLVVHAGFDSGTQFDVARSFLFFDTSVLGADAEVTAASLFLYVYSITGPGGVTLCAQKGTQSTPLVGADFDAFSGSAYGTVEASDSVAPDTHNSIAFNATGCADIPVEGTALICVREYVHDYLDATPGASSWNCEWAAADFVGTRYDPYLAVDALIPATGTPFAIDADTGEITITADAAELAVGQVWKLAVRVTDDNSDTADATVTVTLTAGAAHRWPWQLRRSRRMAGVR